MTVLANNMRTFYLIAAIVGTVAPWVLMLPFLAQFGLDLPRFLMGLFANNPAAALTTDFLITSFVFWVWAYTDAKARGISYWWIVIPLNLGVGLSLAFPLYLYMRETRAVSEA